MSSWLWLLCAMARAADAPGAADHALVKRYEGAEIIGYEVKAFERFSVPTGPATKQGSTWTLARSEPVEGRHTRLIYAAPAGRSPDEVMRNYTAALGEAGFAALWSCTGEACGPKSSMVTNVLYPSSAKLSNLGRTTEYAFNFPEDGRLYAARLSRAEGDVLASVYVAKESFTGIPATAGRTLILLDVVEQGKLEQRMVDASAMARDLADRGRVALYDLYFDTGSAQIKPESDPTLGEIAKLMGQDPGLKLYVVGHTDDVGAYEKNLELSRQRAEAVVQVLVARYGVASTRLVAAGVGPLAPWASNATDEGRALNRRVELVRK